ncbi:ATPase family AAA domain-containing protein 1-A-like [Homarus americanus]|uniref:ATPase family AAA domain-containing protein 1-A-like n=1 Tax=Homarus americanus TaxID=6706 RepID=A0A8J5JGG6_HOMAM|nr:ATPase family AAA domain-containing protein 1-A-like [Homarus americanus]
MVLRLLSLRPAGMEGGELTRGEVLSLLVRLAFATAASYFTVKLLVSAMDPTAKQKKDAKRKLSEYEMMIASQLVEPSQLTTSWKDVAGLTTVIRELRETLILPIQQRNRLQASKLIQPPKGVLLHGPPGCGKTLLARAVAKEAGSRFINLDVAALTDKWYGESQKLSSAVFSLASKIQPCIIFIDEIDSFLRVRATGDHEATAMMKAQFLQQWDGLATDHSRCVVVMGATNRPQDVDRAILRRMPAAFQIPLPGMEQREDILHLVLRDESVADDTNIASLARQTESFSGSDLLELCRTASVYRLRHLLDETNGLGDDTLGQLGTWDVESTEPLRSITTADFKQALTKMRESRVYNRQAEALLKMDLD